MRWRPRRAGIGAGHIVAGLALAALALMVVALCQLLTQGTP
jgi:hypothetical protein